MIGDLFTNPPIIGPKEMQRLLDAVPFYENAGFQYTNTSWVAEPGVIAVTKPPQVKDFQLVATAVANRKIGIVASAEQSFLQLAENEHQQWQRQLRGKWMSITPCFRNENVHDELHHLYFMKLELIQWGENRIGYLHQMIEAAEAYFRQFAKVDVVENELKHENGFDIVTRHGRIELGSYGCRRHDEYGCWIYGTGVAEPRLTQALEKE